MRRLEADLMNVSTSAGSSQTMLSATQEDLNRVSGEIAKLYYLMCEVNGNTPNRVMLEHAKGRQFARQPSSHEFSGNVSDGGASEKSGSERDEKSPIREFLPLEPLVIGSGASEVSLEQPASCRSLLETVHDQIRYLRFEVEKSADAWRQKQLASAAQTAGSGEDVMELQEQLMKLKAMLATKREQIATLRSVLKANKAVAEKALANLKQKYETEKVLVADTMQKLRGELRGLKEDAATFASLRGMFAKRCDEYVTQLNEQQRQLLAAEEEKKTLNALLRMAIQQKIALTQKLEDVEFDRERRNHRQRHNMPGSAGGFGSSRGKPGTTRVSRRSRDGASAITGAVWQPMHDDRELSSDFSFPAGTRLPRMDYY
jgi:protein bicaudal D